MNGDDNLPPVPMSDVIACELEIIGSHGMQAHKYPEMLDLISRKKIPLEKMIGERITLEEGSKTLTRMGTFTGTGISIINHF